MILNAGRWFVAIAALILIAGCGLRTPPAGVVRHGPAALPNHIRGHDLVADGVGPADELECIPAKIRIGAMRLQCRSLMGLPHATVVGRASFASGGESIGAIACGDIAADQAPPQEYPFGCVWLPGATDESLKRLPQP